MKSKLIVPAVSAIIGAAIVGGVWGIQSTVSNNENAVASVGGNAITHADIQSMAEQVSGSQVLSQLITNQLVTNAAKAQNLTATTSEVNNDLTSLEMQNGITNDSQLQQALAQTHMTKADLLDELKIQVLEEKLAQNKVNVTDKQISDYYAKNKTALATPATVSLSDIVVNTKAQAQTVLSLLKAGRNFAQVAKDFSTDTNTKDKSGLLGTFTKNQLDASIANAAFALKAGELSSPIQVSSGYEILKCNGRTDAVIPPLDKVKSKIKTTLQQQSMESPAQLVADLAKAGKVKISDSSYSSVLTSLENPTTSSSSDMSTGQ